MASESQIRPPLPGGDSAPVALARNVAGTVQKLEPST